jgi:hypothetical protein
MLAEHTGRGAVDNRRGEECPQSRMEIIQVVKRTHPLLKDNVGCILRPEMQLRILAPYVDDPIECSLEDDILRTLGEHRRFWVLSHYIRQEAGIVAGRVGVGDEDGLVIAGDDSDGLISYKQLPQRWLDSSWFVH